MTELWDVYDRHRNKSGRAVERGKPMAAGDFHIVVHVWLRNSRGEWLISKRSPAKEDWPGWWETTGGSALVGDDSLAAALREVKEELGIDLDHANGSLWRIIMRENHHAICDIWIFQHDCPIGDVVYQQGETCDAMWAGKEKILEMIENGEFYPFHYIGELMKAYS